MRGRGVAALFAATWIAAQSLTTAAWADNPMGYRLLAPDEAATLPRNHGALGMDIERAQRINDDGMAFDLLRIKGVHRGSAGAQAGLRPGDEIIAVDGRVFANLASFAAYVGSVQPGTKIAIDTIPAGGGPQQAQRVTATVGRGGQAEPAASGMSTGTKVAIGLGAVALFGCYEMGCFSHRQAAPQGAGGQNPGNVPNPASQAYPAAGQAQTPRYVAPQ